MAIHSLLHRLNQRETRELFTHHLAQSLGFLGMLVAIALGMYLFDGWAYRLPEKGIPLSFPVETNGNLGHDLTLTIDAQGVIWLANADRPTAIEADELADTLRRLGCAHSGLHVVVLPEGQVRFQRLIEVLDALLSVGLADYELT